MRPKPFRETKFFNGRTTEEIRDLRPLAVQKVEFQEKRLSELRAEGKSETRINNLQKNLDMNLRFLARCRVGETRRGIGIGIGIGIGPCATYTAVVGLVQGGREAGS